MTDSATIRSMAAILRGGGEINPDDLEQVAIRVARMEWFVDEVTTEAAETERLMTAPPSNVVQLRRRAP